MNKSVDAISKPVHEMRCIYHQLNCESASHMVVIKSFWQIQMNAIRIAMRINVMPIVILRSQRGRVSCSSSVTWRLRSASNPHSGQARALSMPRKS